MRSFPNAASSAKPFVIYFGGVALAGTLAATSLAVLCRHVVDALPAGFSQSQKDGARSRVAKALLARRRAEARRKRVRAVAQQTPSENWPTQFAEINGWFERSFVDAVDEEGSSEDAPLASSDSAAKSYRTVCVRLCDGSFTPMSFATTHTYLRADQVKCESEASTPSRLFVAPSSNGTLAAMTDLSGQPYTALPTAFRFRSVYDTACRTPPPPVPAHIADVQPRETVPVVPSVTAEATAPVLHARESSAPQVRATTVRSDPPMRTVEPMPPRREVDARELKKDARAGLPRPMGLGARAEEAEMQWRERRDIGSKKFDGADWRLSAYQHY
jgi:hypothetical protein